MNRTYVAVILSLYLSLGSPAGLMAVDAADAAEIVDNALPASIARHVPDAALVGSGTLSVLFFDVFDASLYAPAGLFREEGSFALTLEYRRALDGERIVERTVKEMRRQGARDEGALADWEKALREIFPDVEQGTRLTGVSEAGQRTLFYRDGDQIGHIDDPQFTRRFFAIWLGEDSSELDLRRRLLGLAG